MYLYKVYFFHIYFVIHKYLAMVIPYTYFVVITTKKGNYYNIITIPLLYPIFSKRNYTNNYLFTIICIYKYYYTYYIKICLLVN